jgi:hypothetical protein
MANKMRRALARALLIDEGEKRALIERILPRGEDGKRALCLKSDADRQKALLAIAAAVSADAITGEQAEELKLQAENAREPAPAKLPWGEDPPPGFHLLSFEERERLGYVRPGEYPSWTETARLNEAKIMGLAVPGHLFESDQSHCGAAEERAVLDNINENASGAARRGAEESNA